MKVEFEIGEEYFDAAARAECRVAFLGLVMPNNKLTVFVCGMSPVDFQEAKDDLMQKFSEAGGMWEEF